MAAIEKLDKLMQRLGFIRPQRYGLLLTPDDRVVSLRPVLDDGLGARVVGWRDNDLASAELPAWQPGGQPAPQPPRRLAPPPPPRAALTISPVAAAPNPFAEYVPQAQLPQPEPAPMFAHAPAAFAPEQTAYHAAPIVRTPRAATPMAPEEDWEWTLAAARARAEAEPVVAAAPAPAPAPAPVVAAVQPRIPIPTLPRMTPASSSALSRLEPVVRAPTPAQPRRFARGTQPVDKDVTHTDVTAAPAPAPAMETRTQIQALPAASDTRPDVKPMPKAGGIPSIKQRMAGR